MAELIPYPWQQQQWQSLVDLLNQQRLPHAILISGASGLGKWHLAECLAALLLCHTPRSGLACGHCRSCQLRQANTHPDLWQVMPESEGKLIKIEQIRQLSAGISATAQQGGRKVIMLGPAEQLNINAANALLKNLEEPTSETHFILISHSASGVLATIRSRCQQLPQSLPSREKVTQWVQDLGVEGDVTALIAMSGGAPLSVSALLQEENQQRLTDFLSSLCHTLPVQGVDLSPVAVWQGMDTVTLLTWWIRLLQLMIRSENRVIFANPQQPFSQSLVELLSETTGCHQQWLFRLLDKLLLNRQQLLRGNNPNTQLLLEDLLLDWYAILKTRASLQTA